MFLGHYAQQGGLSVSWHLIARPLENEQFIHLAIWNYSQIWDGDQNSSHSTRISADR